MPEVNYLAVIAAAVATFALGGLWYSPALFGKAWQREAGVTEEKMKSANMALIFGLTFVLALIAAWVFALFLGPRPPMALGLGAGFSAGLCWVGGEPRHQLPLRAEELEALADQRRLPHAAVHDHRAHPRALALMRRRR